MVRLGIGDISNIRTTPNIDTQENFWGQKEITDDLNTITRGDLINKIKTYYLLIYYCKFTLTVSYSFTSSKVQTV